MNAFIKIGMKRMHNSNLWIWLQIFMWFKIMRIYTQMLKIFACHNRKREQILQGQAWSGSVQQAVLLHKRVLYTNSPTDPRGREEQLTSSVQQTPQGGPQRGLALSGAREAPPLVGEVRGTDWAQPIVRACAGGPQRLRCQDPTSAGFCWCDEWKVLEVPESAERKRRHAIE